MFKAVIIYVILHCEEIWRTAGSNEKITAVNLGVWLATIQCRINYQWLIQDLYWTEIKNRVGNTTARSILSLPNTFIVTVSTTYQHLNMSYIYHIRVSNVGPYTSISRHYAVQYYSSICSLRLPATYFLTVCSELLSFLLCHQLLKKCQTFTIFTMMAKIQCNCNCVLFVW